jgi:hypothetical protein
MMPAIEVQFAMITNASAIRPPARPKSGIIQSVGSVWPVATPATIAINTRHTWTALQLTNMTHHEDRGPLLRREYAAAAVHQERP